MSVTEHLDEMRGRIISSLIWLAAGTIIASFFAKDVITLLISASRTQAYTLIITSPTEFFTVYIKVSVFGGLFLSGPAILYNVWAFARPSLSDKNFNVPSWIFAVMSCFAAGSAFGYYIAVPNATRFLLSLGQNIALPMMSVNSMLSFVIALILTGGIMFELPVIAALLTLLQIVTSGYLRKKWKETVFGLCVLAAVITPTTDIFNMAIFVLPLILLYELSIWVAYFTEQSMLKIPGKELYENADN